MKTLSIIAALLIWMGCGPANKSASLDPGDTASTDTLQPDGTIEDTPTASTNINTPASKEIRTFKGLYTFGNEVSTFRDCDNPSKVYWLEDESKKMNESYKKAHTFLAYPYESIYVELKGYLKGKSTIGYAAEYENVLAVTEVTTAKQKSFNTACFAYEFVCLGNEPFWSVDIIPSEKIIALKDVGSEKTYTFPYKPAKVSGNTLTYQTSNDKKQSIKILITKQTCSDGMSDRRYNYYAQVSINEKRLRGCAIKKGDKL